MAYHGSLSEASDDQSRDGAQNDADHQVLEGPLRHGLQKLIDSLEIRTGRENGFKRELTDPERGRAQHEPDHAAEQRAYENGSSNRPGPRHVGYYTYLWSPRSATLVFRMTSAMSRLKRNPLVPLALDRRAHGAVGFLDRIGSSEQPAPDRSEGCSPG